jgi:hypothetical protein
VGVAVRGVAGVVPVHLLDVVELAGDQLERLEQELGLGLLGDPELEPLLAAVVGVRGPADLGEPHRQVGVALLDHERADGADAPQGELRAVVLARGADVGRRRIGMGGHHVEEPARTGRVRLGDELVVVVGGAAEHDQCVRGRGLHRRIGGPQQARVGPGILALGERVRVRLVPDLPGRDRLAVPVRQVPDGVRVVLRAVGQDGAVLTATCPLGAVEEGHQYGQPALACHLHVVVEAAEHTAVPAVGAVGLQGVPADVDAYRLHAGLDEQVERARPLVGAEVGPGAVELHADRHAVGVDLGVTGGALRAERRTRVRGGLGHPGRLGERSAGHQQGRDEQQRCDGGSSSHRRSFRTRGSGISASSCDQVSLNLATKG